MKRRPLSLTLRVALLLSAVSVASFVAVGAYLYHTLQRQMASRDDIELIAKVDQLRRIIAGLPSAAAIASDGRALTDTLYGHNDFMLRVNAADGKPLLQTSVTSRPLPQVDSVPVQRALTLDDIHDWQPAAGIGRMVRATALAGAGAAGGEPVQVTLARERSDRLKLLRGYAGDLLLALGGGALLATLLGYAIVRHSMRQLRSVVAKANDISTSRMNTRLSVQDAPVELRELGVAFNGMLNRLEDGVQRLSGFAADLAHDMRTPVNTLMVETQVALSRARTVEEYQALLASNSEEYERLSRMIENTLFLARADNAQLALRRETLDLRAELQRIHDYFEILADDVGVRLNVEAEALRADIDPVLLQRAVSNLVANAIPHTPAGGQVTLSARAVADGVEIQVSNSGPGIAAAHLPHIFDRYYRADPARSAGAGLGLSIVRAIMELHGGKITVDSQSGLTTFSLRFEKK
ncbi:MULTISPECIES: heavy metal sensor histidine kinase [unclassified Duganella]|uniref:heavy metal sensor histidine kinase n=1 Tax=unclassified Duganella TaxID=2636909 RepID=UPI00088B4711|nr:MULTISPECIES: heavy metal sensor histidine kinase [unclassified Duganella]SDF38622.1 two-component system, OmpR family, heavy metal sensor histidine kinase CusS [Duganella sp. OV458]SDI87850.1 two-component system, OmpR family, heavy metal sensor histidine kinase CusS [Duganella sp. OV510]